MTEASPRLTKKDVEHIAKLANVSIKEEEEEKLTRGFNTVLGVVDLLNAVDVAGVEPTTQVTGLTNAFREDTVDEAAMFDQKKALANAKKTHNGFFVVERVLEE